MCENRGIAAVERVAAGLRETLAAEFQPLMGDVELRCEWNGDDFSRIALAAPAGGLDIIVTSVVGEAGADVRVVAFNFEDHGVGDFISGAYGRELWHVARAVVAIPGVDSVWPDMAWPKAFFASVRLEGGDS
jgi:hypothetical protein